jgi:tubulin---tyrosine ligase
MLALFSAVPYSTPAEDEDSSIDLRPHLTNTSLQTYRGEEGVRLLNELVGCDMLCDSGHQWKLAAEHVNYIVDQVADILAETFRAALEDSSVHFQVHSFRRRCQLRC